jgi:hypothetical protein
MENAYWLKHWHFMVKSPRSTEYELSDTGPVSPNETIGSVSIYMYGYLRINDNISNNYYYHCDILKELQNLVGLACNHMIYPGVIVRQGCVFALQSQTMITNTG